MRVEYMALDGTVDRELFLRQLASSDEREAAFLLTRDGTVYVMPFGNYIPGGIPDRRFAGPYRRHTFVLRDFEIDSRRVVGGGYVRLRGGRVEYSDSSKDYGRVRSETIPEIVEAINEVLFPD